MAIGVIQQTLYFMASYIGIIVLLFLGLQFLTKGWLGKYLKVKASRGKKILVNIISPTDTYYSIGQFKEKGFKYKLRDGTKQINTEVKRTDIYTQLGIFNISLDEETGSIYSYPGGSVAPGITPEGADDLITRALQAPTHNDKFKIIMIALIVVAIITGAVAIFMIADVKTALLEIGQISGVI